MTTTLGYNWLKGPVQPVIPSPAFCPKCGPERAPLRSTFTQECFFLPELAGSAVFLYLVDTPCFREQGRSSALPTTQYCLNANLPGSAPGQHPLAEHKTGKDCVSPYPFRLSFPPKGTSVTHASLANQSIGTCGSLRSTDRRRVFPAGDAQCSVLRGTEWTRVQCAVGPLCGAMRTARNRATVM